MAKFDGLRSAMEKFTFRSYENEPYISFPLRGWNRAVVCRGLLVRRSADMVSRTVPGFAAQQRGDRRRLQRSQPFDRWRFLCRSGISRNEHLLDLPVAVLRHRHRAWSRGERRPYDYRFWRPVA